MRISIRPRFVATFSGLRRWPGRLQWAQVWIIAALVALWGLFTPNPLLVMLAAFVLAAIGPLTWVPGQFPVLPYLAAMSWLAGGVPILMASLAGQHVGEVDQLPETETAAALQMIGVLALALGMRSGRGRSARPDSLVSQDIESATATISRQSLFIAYMTGLVLVLFSEAFFSLIPGTQQFLLPLLEIRWVFLFFILWCAIWRDDLRLFAILAFLLELAIGFSGYFSLFKEVLFLAALIFLWALSYGRLKLAKGWLLVLAAFGIYLLTFWQAVKVDYRGFVNQGTNQQVVLVSPQQRAEFLLQKADEMTWEQLSEGWTSGLERVSYISYFGYAISYVPAVEPYQFGKLWLGGIEHVLKPRILFPGKAILDDSERVRQFTGLQVSGHEQGTQINLGIFAESYVDFGPYFMFVPIFIVGFLYSQVFRLILRISPSYLMGTAFAATILFDAQGGSPEKLIGGLTMPVLVYGLLLRYWGARLWVFLISPSNRPSTRKVAFRK
jgi:hypothetical protein